MTIDEYRRGIPNYKGENGQTVGMLCETKEQCITDDDGVSLPDKLAGLKKYTDDAYANSNLYTDTKIGELINGAPTTLDTLKEVADAMEDNADVVEALDKAVGSKVDQAEYDGHADNGTIHITAEERNKWNNNSGGSADLSNYLPKSGGTLTGLLTLPSMIVNGTGSAPVNIINNSALDAFIEFLGNNGASNVRIGLLGMNGANTPVFKHVNGTIYPLLHGGNYADYALPVNGGGAVKSSSTFPLELESTSALDNSSFILFKNKGSNLGFLGFHGANNAVVLSSGGNTLGTVIHTGNVGDYALPIRGGVIGDGTDHYPLVIKGNAGNKKAWIGFRDTTNIDFGFLGMTGVNNPVFIKNDLVTSYPLHHDGNSAKCVVVDTDPGVGASVSYADGTLIFVKE